METEMIFIVCKQTVEHKQRRKSYQISASPYKTPLVPLKMGLFDKLATMLKVKKEQVNILLVGLNNSGKSTIVNHFKDTDERSSIIVPTVGFNVERFQSKFNSYPKDSFSS